MDVRYHFIREKYVDGQFQYIETECIDVNIEVRLVLVL